MSDCFIKLALSGETSTKGYRLLKVSQPYGVSLEDIKHEAIVLYCDTSGIERKEFEYGSVIVDLEFRDNEGDVIIVETDLDLRNFSSSLPTSYIGKVFANVSSTTNKAKSESGIGTESSSATAQTETKTEEKTYDDQKIVNAIADIFSIAAVSMKAGITAAMTAKELSLATVKSTQKITKESLKLSKRLMKENYKMMHSHRSVRNGGVMHAVSVSLEPSYDENQTDTASGDHKPSDMDSKDIAVAEEDEKQEAGAENTDSIPPFIHGRHTCDQCLTTPIVGKRYHALNLPDYDLCTMCYGNYKGSEVVFEEAQLERDVPYQERWNHKRAMLEGHLKHRFMRRSHCRRVCKLDRPSRKDAPPSSTMQGPSSVNSAPISETSLPPAVSGLEDLELNEAIRRSLSDVAGSNESTGKVKLEEPKREEDVDMSESPIVAAEPDIVVSAESVQDEDVSTENKDTSFAVQAIGSGEVAEFVGETLDRMSEAIDELNRDVLDKGDLIFERNLLQQDGEFDSDDDSSGSKIVDGEEDAASTGSWSVVVEKENTVDEDGGLGQAAQALGSALFQSDMMRSTEGTSAAMSSVTSVPTVAPSIDIAEQSLSPVQFERWAVQLEQLHDLGFMDDVASIDALEALTAANIGVDSSEEVTVERVISKLMGD